MKVKYYCIIFVSIFIFTACTGANSVTTELSEKVEEVESLNNILNEKDTELAKLQTVINEKNEVINTLNTEIVELEENIEKISITKEEKLIIDFFNNYNGRIGQDDFQPIGRLQAMDSKEPIRLAPSLNAPYIYNDNITFEYDDSYKFSSTVEVYDYVISEGKEWAVINEGNFNVGYVLREVLSEYEAENTFEIPKYEGFNDIEIGSTVDDIMNRYKDRIQLINERNGYDIMIQVKAEGKDVINSRYDMEIAFYYDTISNRINFIQATSDKYVLQSGYKVGDNTLDVFDYYNSKYEIIEAFSNENYKRYDIGNGYTLEIGGDIEDDGKVYIIRINSGYNIYF